MHWTTSTAEELAQTLQQSSRFQPGSYARSSVLWTRLFRNSLSSVLLVFTCLYVASTASAKSFDVTVTVTPSAPARAQIQGRTEQETKAWSLPATPFSSSGRGERVSNFTLADSVGAEVRVRKLGPGEFEADRAATQFSYELKLKPPLTPSDAAHVSWLADSRGVLFLSDILPVLSSPGRVTFKLPEGWQIFSVETKNRQGAFEVPDAARSLFVIGQDLRVRRVRAGSMDVSYLTAGEWAFPEDEFVSTSKETLDDYGKVIGGTPRRHSMVALLPFPVQVAGNVWSAETRGGTVLMLSGRLPSKFAALAQLQGALTHELFHLWVPNGLALSGEYGWFYEGFTLYQALRAGMRQGRLTFQDYLTALGRAFDGYKSVRGQTELSLIEASERRWTGSPALVYHKGMLVAFLYDLTLLQKTEGKSSLDAVYRELYRRYGGSQQRIEASPAVTSVLSAATGMKSFTDDYIQKPIQIDLKKEIEIFGLRVEPGGISTRVVVADSITREQRDLLGRLGYNVRR